VSTREAVPVTVGNQIIEDLSISPDGEWLAYDGKRRGNMDIYKQPLEGGSTQLLADDSADLFAPAWSPDGNQVAVYGGSDVDIYLIAADGTRQAIVTGPGFDNGATWSPDGLALAYTSQGGDVEAVASLWVMRRDSVGGTWGEARKLTDFQCPFPGWSPDGQGIVCSNDFRAVIVSPDGGILRQLDLSGEGFAEVWLFRFANDGSVLYFGGRHRDGRAGIWSIPTNGGVPPSLLVVDDPARPMHWLASYEFGGRFYFTLSEYESDIYVMDLKY
jgi:WD40 repeat protein